MRKADLDLQAVKIEGKGILSRRTFYALRQSFTSAFVSSRNTAITK